MKKGKDGVKKSKRKHNSKASKHFATRYERRSDHPNSGYTRVHYEVPPSEIGGGKKSSESNFDAAFDSTKNQIGSRRMATVHCINEHRKSVGLAEVHGIPSDTSDSIQDFIAAEADIYAKWSMNAIKSRERTEMAYYSKSAHRRKKALEYKDYQNPKPKKLSRPNVEYGICTDTEVIMQPNLPAGNAFGHARKKPRSDTQGLAPSGLPLSEFLEGGKYPPRKRDVTTSNNRPSSIPSDSALALMERNDPAWRPEVATIKWFINNVSPDNWPSVISQYIYYVDGDYKPDKKKLFAHTTAVNDDNIVAAIEQDYSNLSRDYHQYRSDAIEQHEKDQETIDYLKSEIARLESEANSPVHGSSKEYRLAKQIEDLKDEIHCLQKELGFAHWEIAVSRDGETDAPPASYQAKSPLGISELATLFNVFKSQCEYDILDTFGRVYGVSKEQRAELRGYFGKQALARMKASDNWKLYLAEQAAKDCYNDRREHMKHIASEVFALNRIGLRGKPPVSEAWTLAKERLVYKRWANRSTVPLCTKRINYAQWWVDNITPLECHNRAVMTTKTYKVLKKCKDALIFANTYELIPSKRKKQQEAERKRQLSAEKRKKKLIAKSLKDKATKASKIKEFQEKQLEERDMRQRIRDAQRIAH